MARDDAAVTHAREIARLLNDAVVKVRAAVSQVPDPGARALFETTAEVLVGLKTACEHYSVGAEGAFRR
jgi:hypothetical protein